MDFNDFVTALMLPHFLVQYDYVEAAQPGRNLRRQARSHPNRLGEKTRTPSGNRFYVQK